MNISVTEVAVFREAGSAFVSFEYRSVIMTIIFFLGFCIWQRTDYVHGNVLLAYKWRKQAKFLIVIDWRFRAKKNNIELFCRCCLRCATGKEPWRIVSYVRHSPGCPANSEFWQGRIILGRSKATTNFFEALSNAETRTNTQLVPYAIIKFGLPTKVAAWRQAKSKYCASMIPCTYKMSVTVSVSLTWSASAYGFGMYR